MILGLLPFQIVPNFVFIFLTDLAKTSYTILNRNGESRQPCLVPDFSGISLTFHLTWCWLLACCKLPLLYWGMFLVSLMSPGFLPWKGVGFCQRSSLYLKRWACGFPLSVCLYGGFHLSIYMCWTIPVSLGWNLLDHGRWSLMYSWIQFTSILFRIFASMFI